MATLASATTAEAAVPYGCATDGTFGISRTFTADCSGGFYASDRPSYIGWGQIVQRTGSSCATSRRSQSTSAAGSASTCRIRRDRL